MIKKPIFFVVAVGLAAAGIAALVIVLRPGSEPTATEVKFGKIKPGMAEKDIHDLLGPRTEGCQLKYSGPSPDVVRCDGWVGKDAVIVVCFDKNGRVVDKIYGKLKTCVERDETASLLLELLRRKF